MKDDFKITGYLKVFKWKDNISKCVFEHSNTIETALYTALRNKLLNRDAAGRGASIDGMACGFRDPLVGYYIGTFAGTFNAGSNGKCVFSTPTIQQIKCVGSFTFDDPVNINYFELGQVYVPPTTSQLINTRYAYQDSLYLANQYVSFSALEFFSVDWTFQIGN
jgi:hypothetical protein